MKDYKSFSELKEELGDNYDFKLYEMGISVLKEVEQLQQENQELKDNWNKLKNDLELVVDYGLGDESSKWDKIYGEYAKSTLKFIQELEQGSDSNEN